MTPLHVDILKNHGATPAQITLFKNLVEKQILCRKPYTAIYDILALDPPDIAWDEYNRFTVFNKIRFPDDFYIKRFHHLATQSTNDSERAYRDLFPNLIKLAKIYSDTPNEKTAHRLYQAFNFNDVFSPNNDPNDGYSPHFFEPFQAAKFDKQTFHVFALFVCFTSDNAHIVQNFLLALRVVPGPIPFALLDVLGRYEPYNLASYELIDRVPHISNLTREVLNFTHLKSMDALFHYNRPDKLQRKEATYWASLNTSSDFFAQYFHDEMLGLVPNHHLMFAALDHYTWCVRKNFGREKIDPDRATLLRKLEGQYYDYLCVNLDLILPNDDHAKWMQCHYINLSTAIDTYDSETGETNIHDKVESLLDRITHIFSTPDFDNILTRFAPDLADHEAGYYSILRPSSHRYNLFIEAKIMAAEVWFPRELKRVQFGDTSNLGTLSLTIRTHQQFNVLSNWLLEIIGHTPLTNSNNNPLGVPFPDLLHFFLCLYPGPSELLLHTRRLLGVSLSSRESKLVKRAIFILYRHKKSGYDIPSEFESRLEKINIGALSNMYARFLRLILEGEK